MDSELEEFKRRIDLREYAASKGYELNRRESSRASAVMESGGDKIIIKRNGNGHYVYFSVRDDQDNGTLIDFVQHRERVSLGVVRKALRPWIGRPASPLPFFTPLTPAQKDRDQVERDYGRMQIALRHPYLETERQVPAALLGSSRFAGRVRIDTRGNAIFPHFDQDGLCGFEAKNKGFTGFSKGGTKGLWESHDQEQDDCLVLSEAAIDALSYAVLFPDARARYRSIGGAVNDQQPGLIKLAVNDLPAGAMVIAAMDNDADGRKLADMVGRAVAACSRPEIAFKIHLPESEGQDWNDKLRHCPQSLLPIAPSPVP